jgi:hypothetical protein
MNYNQVHNKVMVILGKVLKSNENWLLAIAPPVLLQYRSFEPNGRKTGNSGSI